MPGDTAIEDGEGEGRPELGRAREVRDGAFGITGDEPRIAPVEQDLGVVGRELQGAREISDPAGRVAEADACRATVGIGRGARLLAHGLVERGQRTTVAALFVEHQAARERRGLGAATDQHDGEHDQGESGAHREASRARRNRSSAACADCHFTAARSPSNEK